MKSKISFVEVVAGALACVALLSCTSSSHHYAGTGGANGEGGNAGARDESSNESESDASSSGTGGLVDGGSAGTGGSGGSSQTGATSGSGGNTTTGGGGNAGSGGDGTTGGVDEPACVEGEERCTDNVAHRCNADGQWQSLDACAGNEVECVSCTLGDTCQSGSDCGGGGCVDGQCTECVPDESDCVGAVPRICSSDGSWFPQPACMRGVCVPEAGTCEDQCQDGEADCVDTGHERRCSDGRWAESPCDLYCAAGVGRCVSDPGLIPGLVACDFDTGESCDTSQGEACVLSYDAIEVRECRTSSFIGQQSQDQYAACDGHDDCDSGEVCCLSQCQGTALCTSCSTTCTLSSTRGPLCDPNDSDPCPAGGTCAEPVLASYVRLLADYDFHQCK